MSSQTSPQLVVVIIVVVMLNLVKVHGFCRPEQSVLGEKFDHVDEQSEKPGAPNKDGAPQSSNEGGAEQGSAATAF